MHIGSTISHYKIVEKLGEGGMGIVYKAQDTTLDRPVALKFLADHLLNDTEAKERFLREAKAAAALHHPNVCPVHEIGEADGKTFIAMAFLKGETLEDRIAKGPLSIKDALDIARQVAEGLQAAHAEGIVHRDIKPANIIVSPEGRPTIMDFGLARLTEASRLTKVDTAMGTVAYMSPEQAQGMEVDSRSDVWALGCVLYEMVAGQRPFLGQYDQALLYEIVHEEVAPLTSIRAGVPMEIEFIVGKCLAKDREDRHQAAKEVAVDLRTLAEKLKSGRSTILRPGALTASVPATMTGAQTLNPAATLPPDAVVVRRRDRKIERGLLALAVLGLLAVLGVHLTETPVDRPVRRFSISPTGLVGAGVISPDGKHIAYVAETEGRRSLWLRSLETGADRELENTTGALVPFWSPDSQSIGFAVRPPEGSLKKIAIGGDSPIALCALPTAGSFLDGSWSPDGQWIAFSSGTQLYEVSARGGEPELLFERPIDRPQSRFPKYLPTGFGPRALVYTASAGVTDLALTVLNLESGERSELPPGVLPEYSSPGLLIYSGPTTAAQGLWALPFSVQSLSATGEPFLINGSGRGPSVSRDGTLVFTESPARLLESLVWRSRSGEIIETIGQPQPNIGEPAFSPDRRQIAVASSEGGTFNVWIHDPARVTKTRLTFDALAEGRPEWSPSGRQIVYVREEPTGPVIMIRSADGSGEAAVLVGSGRNHVWSRDGQLLVYDANNAETNWDIQYLRVGADGAAGSPTTFLATAANEEAPQLSPDGRFLAYVSDESGRHEIYVRPFPDGAGRWQASTNGGTQPRWRGDGGELYYVEQTALVAVPVSQDSGFSFGRPERLFEAEDLSSGNAQPQYNLAADGQRFVTVAPYQQAAPMIQIVENWYEEFRNRQQ